MNSYTIQYGDTLSGIASKTGKSIQELMRLNPSITDPNKIYAGRTLSLGASAAPTPPPTPTPTKQTIAQVAKVTVPNYVEDPTTSKIGQTYKSQATDTINEEAIRAATRNRIQGQIDAINAAVADQIANFRNTTAKNRQGQSYALAAAGGRIGSATGESEFQKTEDYNNQEEQTYRSEANLKISQLFGQATRDADAEIKTRREAIQQGIDKYFEFLDNQGTRKRDQVSAFVKNMLALGVDPSSLSDSDFEKLQDQKNLS
jgi:murein DD-endopeptidase MepM/ murein hydrolase activator NlpD